MLAEELAALKTANERMRTWIAGLPARLHAAKDARIVGSDSFDSRRRRAIDQLIAEMESESRTFYLAQE